MSNPKLISTSALAKKLSINKYQLDELLLAAKYIVRDGDKYKLTDLGMQNSFIHRQKLLQSMDYQQKKSI